MVSFKKQNDGNVIKTKQFAVLNIGRIISIVDNILIVWGLNNVIVGEIGIITSI